MTGDRRPIPADMLLLHERRRRMTGQQPAEATTHPRAPGTDDDEIFSADEDLLIEDESNASVAPATGDVLLRRPISQVSLVQVSWSGPIDHEALQSALACQPTRTHDAVAYPGIFQTQPFPASDGGAALEVRLQADDLAVLTQLAGPRAGAASTDVLHAALLPNRLTGVEPATRAAVSPVLAAYRHASLSCAWHERLSGAHSVQSHRERDEAAVAVLSTLRALLGER